MRKYLGYLIWAACCIGITMMVVFQTASIFGAQIQLLQLTSYLIGNIQKLFFNNMLYFSVLIYLGRKSYMDVHAVIRCKKRALELALYMNYHGMRLCGLFVLMLFSGLLISALLADVAIYITLDLFFFLVLSVLFAFSWYTIYAAAYVVSKNQMIGMFILVISQLGIVVTYSFLEFICDIDISKYFINFIYPIMVIIITEGIQIYLLSKREWY